MERLSVILRRRKNSDRVYNPYTDERILNNLILFLEETYKQNSGVLFVGEAPGYLGARITGIPFTSGEVIVNCTHRIFCKLKDRIFLQEIRSENTARIFWRTMAQLRIVPVVWNAFPFHPFVKGKPSSNRKPSGKEIEEGEEYLRMIVEIFKPEIIFSVGRTAEKSVRTLFPEKRTIYVRHPARGGENRFVDGVMDVVKNSQNLFP